LIRVNPWLKFPIFAPSRLCVKNIFAWFAVQEMMASIGCSRCAAGHFFL
jgi:hypothetical protein